MTQVEILVPPQPPRITLALARLMRDQIEKLLAKERPTMATEITKIALCSNGAEKIYRKVRPSFYRKRSVDRLRDLGRFVHALESRRRF
jgi:hypothetical protein